MGIAAIGPKTTTSKPAPGHKIFPYLLRGLTIDRANQVGAADITYIPIGRGFLYLVAIIDWASRAVLSWRLSNTLDTRFCIDALEEALARFGKPAIFNTDQGSQFTSTTGRLAAAGIQISMAGRGRWMDNVFDTLTAAASYCQIVQRDSEPLVRIVRCRPRSRRPQGPGGPLAPCRPPAKGVSCPVVREDSWK